MVKTGYQPHNFFLLVFGGVVSSFSEIMVFIEDFGRRSPRWFSGVCAPGARGKRLGVPQGSNESSPVSGRPPNKEERLCKEALLAIVCPADAVLAKLPFPSKQGWITVGALLTSNQGLSLNRAQPSLHGIIISGLGHWPGIPNTAGQNTYTFLGKVAKN